MSLQAGKYSTGFWSCYFLYVAWSLLSILSFPLEGAQAGQSGGAPEFQVALSKIVFSRDLVFTAIAISCMTMLMVFRSLFLGKWLLFVAAWMWAVSVDDFLALERTLFLSEGFGPHAVMAMRPLVLLAVSWMAFEAVSRGRAPRVSRHLSV